MKQCAPRFGFLLLALIFAAVAYFRRCKRADSDDFSRLSNLGRTYYEKGEPEKAVTAFEKAAQLNPSHPDARLNLANAYLLANQPAKAAEQAQSLIDSDHNSAAGYYVLGCAFLRLNKAED